RDRRAHLRGRSRSTMPRRRRARARAGPRGLNTTMTGRMRRVNEAVRQVLSEAVGELKDPRIGFVTVTGVETSPDLRHARVFVSVLGTENRRTQTLAGLQAAHSVLQSPLARE